MILYLLLHSMLSGDLRNYTRIMEMDRKLLHNTSRRTEIALIGLCAVVHLSCVLTKTGRQDADGGFNNVLALFGAVTTNAST